MFSNPFHNAFGLDIGDLTIKLVQLQKHTFSHKKPHYELTNYRSVSIPPGLIVNGEMQKPEEIRKYIQKLLKGNSNQKPIKSPWIVATLPENKSFIKLIQVKKNADELIDEDIINIAKKHIPFDEDNYYLQWQIIPDSIGNTPKTRILIGAAPKAIADSYTYLFESLGLGVVALEIEAIALTRAMITAHKKYENEARAILDIGATRSCLIVYDNDVVQFSTSIPYSGELLTTALMQRAHLSYEEAEEMKKNVGLEYSQNKNQAWQVMSDLTEELVTGIKNALDFYYSHFSDTNKVTRIIMCGGGANLPKLDRVISSQLKLTARPGMPWKNLSSTKPINISSEVSLNYATAIGLALRAADNPFFTKYII